MQYFALESDFWMIMQYYVKAWSWGILTNDYGFLFFFKICLMNKLGLCQVIFESSTSSSTLCLQREEAIWARAHWLFFFKFLILWLFLWVLRFLALAQAIYIWSLNWICKNSQNCYHTSISLIFMRIAGC